MKTQSIRILLIDGNENHVSLISTALKQSALARFDLEVINHPTALKNYLNPIDLILLDLEGLEQIKKVQDLMPGVPITVLTNAGDDQTGYEAIRRGAQDFLPGDRIDGYHLSHTIINAVERQRAADQQARRQSHVFFERALDALSAHVAVLDETGVVIAVNEAWQKFAVANQLPGLGVGQNYLHLCDAATGPQSEEAREVAAGIRKVLAGEKCEFQLEYSPTEQRWFLLQVRRFEIAGIPCVVVSHHDITERRLAEEALLVERKLLRTVINHMPDRIFAKDREGHYLIKNAADLRQMKAPSLEAAIGKTDFDFYPEDLAAQYFADDQLVIQYGQSLINREEPAPGPDSSMLCILTTKVPLRDQKGEITGLVGIGRDITELKRAQERLQKYTDEVNLLYRISGQLAQTLDLKTIYAILQDAIVSYMSCDELYISSYTAEEMHIDYAWIGKNDQLTDIPDHLLLAAKQIHRSVLQTGETLYLPDYRAWLQSFQSELPSLTPCSALLLPLRIENQVFGVIHVFSHQPDACAEDKRRFLEALAPQAAAASANAHLYLQAQHEVAERVRAEAALYELNEALEQRIAERTLELRNSESRYRAIIEDQTELVCRYLPDRTITFANDAYCHFFKRSREMLLNRPFLPNILEEDRAEWEKKFALLTQENPVIAVEHRTIAGNGKVHWLQWTHQLIADSGEIQGVGRDVTRQKQAEEALRQALAHEIELNDIRSRFISMASHDLRTPLAVIQSSTDLLSDYNENLSSERKEVIFSRIQSSIQHMVELLDDILLFARADAGRLEFAPEKLNLIAFCNNLLSELKASIGTQHRLDFSANNGGKPVWADPKLLRHIINNLVSNAIKYSPAGSTVKIELKHNGSLILLSVADQGIGIPIEDQKNLFRTFFRGKNVSHIPGTGLGLAIVQQSVELHGGSISFESHVGEGTTFLVALPSVTSKESG